MKDTFKMPGIFSEKPEQAGFRDRRKNPLNTINPVDSGSYRTNN